MAESEKPAGSLYVVTVRRASAGGLGKPREQEFLFQTNSEAVAFMHGLRVHDAWPKTHVFLSASMELKTQEEYK